MAEPDDEGLPSKSPFFWIALIAAGVVFFAAVVAAFHSTPVALALGAAVALWCVVTVIRRWRSRDVDAPTLLAGPVEDMSGRVEGEVVITYCPRRLARDRQGPAAIIDRRGLAIRGRLLPMTRVAWNEIVDVSWGSWSPWWTFVTKGASRTVLAFTLGDPRGMLSRQRGWRRRLIWLSWKMAEFPVKIDMTRVGIGDEELLDVVERFAGDRLDISTLRE